MEFIARERDEKPVLLLDDIFSELDEESRTKVAKVIPRQQTFISAAEKGLIGSKFLAKMKVIKL